QSMGMTGISRSQVSSIISALAARDSEAAIAAMRAYILSFQRALLGQ
ncbi:hypothetical protein ACZ87_02793, partial [Candidatus Erwinia dacicola]